jgi:lysophospholipase L1-like esterase
VCFEAAPSYACTAQSPVYTTTGVVEWSSKFVQFYQYDRVDWTRVPRNVALILKDTKDVKPAPENVGAAEAARYLPTKLKVRVTIVPPDPAAPSPSPAPAALPAPPAMAFPGQWAVPAGRHPVWPSGCSRFPDPYERLACLEHLGADFSSLGRFRDANAAVTPSRAGERRVVFCGDSITDNWSKPGMGGFFAGKPYINRGIGGQTTAQMLVRFRADVLAHRPKAVVILAGTNDVAGNAGPTSPAAIQDNLASMAEMARAAGVRVVLASLLPVRDDKKDGRGALAVRTRDRPPETLRGLNAWVADYAKKNRHVFLDYWRALADEQGLLRPGLTDDGLHPNAAGYAVMAPLAERAIDQALGRGR